MQQYQGRGHHQLPQPNVREFTNDSANRNKAQFPYAHALLDEEGRVIVETIHGTTDSLCMDVQHSAKRIAAGEPAIGGQVPTKIVVDGVADEEWQKWIK